MGGGVAPCDPTSAHGRPDPRTVGHTRGVLEAYPRRTGGKDAQPIARAGATAMTRDEVLAHCLDERQAIEDYPFGDEVAVFKVRGKMFALVALDGPLGSVTLKCDPDLALELRDRHPAVRPGYHTNKRHWNTVDLDGSLDPDDLREMIDHSYDLVVAGLTRRERAQLEA